MFRPRGPRTRPRRPQLAGFQKLHESITGLQVLGFPCNQFGKQEPGSADDIAKFYADKFGVTFPLFVLFPRRPSLRPWSFSPRRDARAQAKGDVNGPDAHPLFTFLKEATAGKSVPVPPWNKGLPADDVQWNFTKWLIVDGKPTERYSFDVTPDMIEPDVRAALGE